MAALTSSGLSELIQAAMKSGDKMRVSVLRLLSSSLRNAEVAKMGDLTDDEALAVVAREVRRREEAATEFEKAEQTGRAETERAEAAILTEWLPEQLSTDELENLVVEAIAESGATGPSQMGNVMKILMPKVRGRADGKVVSELVRANLGG